jgi:hypothetical protein
MGWKGIIALSTLNQKVAGFQNRKEFHLLHDPREIEYNFSEP